MINDSVVNLVKLGNAVFVSSGVSTIVGYAARSAVPKKVPHLIRASKGLTKTWQLFHKVAIPAGATALAGMAAHYTVAHTDKEIDQSVKALNDLIAKAQQDKINNGPKHEAESEETDG